MPKVGRPRKKINWEEFDKLCAIQCTMIEIAAWFNCSVDTMERAIKMKFRCNFADIYAQKKQMGKISIRRQMFQRIQDGNPTMLIWLSKQHLGMREKVENQFVDKSEDKKLIIQFDKDDDLFENDK